MSRLAGTLDLALIADWHKGQALAARNRAKHAFDAGTVAAEPHDAADIAARQSMLRRAREAADDAIDHARMALTLRALGSLRHG